MYDETRMDRRQLLVSAVRMLAAGSAAMTILPTLARGTKLYGGLAAITVYKDPSCGCCKKWVAHLRDNGFGPTVTDRTDMATLKDSMSIPSALRSCHTAVTGRYIIEGHVPAADIRRLLATVPKDILGLAAPGMPMGSPGMEGPGPADAYTVIAFGAKGATREFARHG